MALFEDTLFYFRVNPGSNKFIIVFAWGALATAVRLGALWALIVVVRHALGFPV